MYRERIKKFQRFLEMENLDAFIVNKRAELLHVNDVRYFCGFSGDTGLLMISRKQAHLIVDGRFHTQAKKEAKGAKMVPAKTRPAAELKEMKQFQAKNMRFGFDPDTVTCEERKTLMENLPNAVFIPYLEAVAKQTIFKDKYEIEMIKKAIEISETALQRVLGYIKPGMREIEVAAELEYQMKMLGSEKSAFETIVASGYRGALPHGLASTKNIVRGDFVTIDYGASYKGYVADITRTIVVGKATSRQKKVYNAVLRANMAGIKKIKAGVKGVMVDAAARKVVERAGFAKYFNHGLGHGIGVYVHVGPSLGPRSTDILKRGMVVTVEPGIYIPKWGGVRIEDDVLVTNTGSQVLTSAPKNLLEV